MFAPVPTSPLQFALSLICLLLFAVAVIAKRFGTAKSNETEGRRSRLSIVGIAAQSLAFFIVSAGSVDLSASSLSPTSVLLSALVIATGLGAVLLFQTSAKALGENWSLVARTRAAHGLVRHGPFARVRHPIYLAMFLLLIAIAFGFCHPWALLAGVPVFLIGTAIRVREEERLLIEQFGEDYRAYARETPAFIPWQL